MIPEDPLIAYYGNAAMNNCMDDFYFKELGKTFSVPAEEKAKVWSAMAEENGPFHKWTLLFEKDLTHGKFICGDKLSFYDVVIGQLFTSVIKNTNNPGAEAWKKALDSFVPARVL